jgi:phage terminase large subunit-like protein
VARPSKSLVEHVRDGSFRPDRHESLLAGPLLTVESLRALQLAYRDAVSERDRRSVALDFAEQARRDVSANGNGGLHVAGAHGGADVARFLAEYLRHTKGPSAGLPFLLEPWQRAFVDEFYSRDDEGRRVYRLGILGIPRGNGKSPLAAGLALFELLTRRDSPDVFCAAASRDQARIVFNFARSFVESGPLIEHLKVGRNEIISEQNLGALRTISADGALQHGLSPSAAIIDELWAFTSTRQEEVITAFATAMHKRIDSFMLAITTAGYDRATVLGRMYGEALERLELEHPDDCLTVGRDEENGTLLWWYGAPEGAEIDDEAMWRRCNPASWLDLRDLRRQRRSPGTTEADFRRLHLDQWTVGEHVWISPERWAGCRGETEIPKGSQVFVGVDASFSDDATAVAWAWRASDGKIVVRSRVWSALEETAAHVHLEGNRIDLGQVEEFILQLARDFRVREVIFDPTYFARSAEILGEKLLVAPIDQRSKAMRESYGQFFEATGAGAVIHDGDPVLSQHVQNAVAELDEFGAWKIRKRKQSRKIDGLVATVIAYARAAREQPKKPNTLVAWH